MVFPKPPPKFVPPSAGSPSTSIRTSRPATQAADLWLGGGGPDGKSAMNRNVCVVGDPAQTIYSFAGASSWDLLRFADEFGPLAADVNLNTDYRSTPEVVNLANRVLAAAPNREDYLKLVSARESGPRVTRTAYESDMEEAQGVAARIARLVANGAKPVRLRDPHPHQRPTAGIRCRLARCETEISRPQGFGMAIIRARRRCRVQTRTIGGDGFGRHRTCRKRRSRGYDFHDPRIQGSGIQARVSDRLFGRALAVWFAETGDALEEERRLMYVGITRAEDSLHLSYARTKDGYGVQRRRITIFVTGVCNAY
mgnify:CR=1 FL=1